MKKRKQIREKGKVRLSRMFQELEIGDRVGVIKELSVRSNFPGRIGGRTGVIEGKRGRSYIVKLKEFNKEKTFIIEAIHLKKLK